MARLIDADAFEVFEFSSKSEDFADGVLYVLDKSDEAPTIEAEPVRHGRWVPLSYDGYTNGYPVYDEWECSECHFACEGEGEPPLNYCPYCGAKLDGGEKE